MTEDQLEQETLGWLGEVGYSHLYGPDIAPDGDSPERANYQQVLLPFRLREAIYRLNPDTRTTGSTRLNEMRFSLDWIECKLAQTEPNSVRRIYNHADHLKDHVKIEKLQKKPRKSWANYDEKDGQGQESAVPHASAHKLRRHRSLSLHLGNIPVR